MDKVLTVYDSPQAAERETCRAYARLTGNERVALTFELQKRYHEHSDAPARYERILTVLERT